MAPFLAPFVSLKKKEALYFYLKYPSQQKKTLIYLKYHISQSEGKFVYSTGQHIEPKDWDFKNKTINHNRGRTDLAIINSKLQPFTDYLITLLNNYNLNNIEVTKEQLKSDFNNKFKQIKTQTRKGFFELANEFIETKKNANQWSVNTIQNIRAVIKNIKKFEAHYNIKIVYNTFLESNEFVDKWLSFCYNELNHIDNTVGSSIAIIKRILIYGSKKKYHNINDLSHLKVIKQETDDVALTYDELMYYYHFDFGDKKYLEKVRDIFCIGCFTGQRFSDYSIFNKLDYKNGMIQKRTKKTKHKTIIPVDANAKLKYLLQKYDFSLPKISEQKFREYLKEGLKLTGKLNYQVKKTSYKGTKAIEKVYQKWQIIGSHTARRTFISIVLQSGWTYKEIMTVAGIKKVETVIKYDKVNSSRLNKKVKDTFG